MLSFSFEKDSFGEIIHGSSTYGWAYSKYYSSPWMLEKNRKTQQEAIEELNALYEEWKTRL